MIGGSTSDPPCLAGRYELREPAGGAPLLESWRAHDLVSNRAVTVDLLADDLAPNRRAAQRFEDDQRAVAGLADHPHVVSVHAVARDGNRPFAVTDRLTEATVADRLSARDAPSAEDALRWLRAAASALDAAHAEGLVHHDVRPGNLLLTDDDEVVVARFAVAALAYESTMVSVGEAVGTAAYLAPEQVLGEPATAATDRYALAVVAYELLTGHLPFDEGPTFTATARARLDSRPARPSARAPDLHSDLDAILLMGLAREPRRRWTSASALVDTLEAALLSPTPALTGEPEPQAAAQTEEAEPEAPAPQPEVETGEAPRPQEQPAPRRERTLRDRLPAVGLVLGTLAVVVVGVITLAGAIGAYDESPGSPPTSQQQAEPLAEDEPQGEPQPGFAVPEPGTAGVDQAGAQDANSEGYALIRAERPEQAVERFTEGLSLAPPDSETHASSLFGLARSLRLAGRPRDGLAVIEERATMPPETQNSLEELESARTAVEEAGD